MRMKLKKYCFLLCLSLILTVTISNSGFASEVAPKVLSEEMPQGSLKASTEVPEEAPAKVVRIGVFEETYNIVNEAGERSGYGYEYLQKIAGYTG